MLRAQDPWKERPMTGPQPTYTLSQAIDATADHMKIAQLIGVWPEYWAGRCHAISLKLLRSGAVGHGRIARGWADGIHSQHSWIVLGDDCYDKDAVVVDPTYWLALNRMTAYTILVDYARNLDRAPHGDGSIFDVEKPSNAGGPIIRLTPKTPLSADALAFLRMLGPLDHRGWMQLGNAPVHGWPAAEIIAAMDDTPRLRAIPPIDILGMITDKNPGMRYQ
jgi:hypothetical protein